MIDLIAVFKDHVFLVAFIGISVLLWMRRHFGRELPPGPLHVPLLGIVPGLINIMTGSDAKKWSDEHKSKVIMVRLMGMPIVIMNSLDLIRDTFTRRSDLVDRLGHNIISSLLDPQHKGIIVSSGEVWRDARRVTIRRMRDFGASGSRAEIFIQREAEYLVSAIRQFRGEAFDPKLVLSKAVSNILNQAMFGKRFDYDDQEFSQTLSSIEQFVRDFSDPTLFLILTSKLGRLLYHKKMNEVRRNWDSIVKFVDEQVDEHERMFDGTIRDVIDAFIDDRNKGDSQFDSHAIRSIVFDMFGAGSDTTLIQLKWIVMYMARYDNVQQRVFEELTDMQGTVCPHVSNRTKTPYTDAVIHEIMRLHPLGDFGISRTNKHDDFIIDGYLIKKGTPVLANYWGVHYNEEYFPDPKQFDPGHFLTDDGQLKNVDKMLSFTVGRRSCAGESLARVEIYLFFAMLIMNFQIRPPEGETIDLTPRVNYINEPREFKIRMISRHGAQSPI